MRLKVKVVVHALLWASELPRAVCITSAYLSYLFSLHIATRNITLI